MTLWFRGRLILPDRIVDNGLVATSEGRISGLWDLERETGPVRDPAAELTGAYIAPGFVDLHVHGGGGSDFMDGEPEAVAAITATHGRHGTTALLATTLTGPEERILQAIRAVKRAPASGARIVGFHIEGPFINPRLKGAQDGRFIRQATSAEIDRWLALGDPGDRWHLTLAPEMEGALRAARHASERGIVVAAGHTDATFAQMRAARDAGLVHATHLFNAMRGLHHREPGTVGAALLLDGLTVELIADGIHLHPAILALAARSRRPDEVILVTDAMRAAGLGPGRYTLGELPVTVADGEARLDDGALAGSVLTMDRAVGNMVEMAGIPLVQAVAMASLNPARRHGLAAELGSLAVGKRADIVILDERYQARLTMVGGTVIFDGR